MFPSGAIVGSEPEYWEKLSGVVSGCGARPIRCETLAAVTKLLSQQHIDFLVCEDAVPDGTFRELIATLRCSGSWAPVIVVSGLDDWGAFLEAMVAGAFDYVVFPPYPGELERAVTAALAESRSVRRAVAQAAA
jgi:DNA-binding NtrC family response regulator